MIVLLRHDIFLSIASLRHSWRRSLLLALVLGLSLCVPLALTSLL